MKTNGWKPERSQGPTTFGGQVAEPRSVYSDFCGVFYW